MRPLRTVYKALYYVVFCIAQTLVRILYPVRALGRENLKGLRGYVLAPNHLSAIDPLFVLMARGAHRKMLIMGKEELFGKNPLLDFFWAVAGAFPVERGAGRKDLIAGVMQEVQAGRDLLIFPEGTRSKTGQLGRLKSGTFVVAAGAGAVVVPTLVRYKAGRPKMLHRCTVVFGKPLTPQELGLAEDHSPRQLRGAKQIFTQRLEELGEQYKDRL